MEPQLPKDDAPKKIDFSQLTFRKRKTDANPNDEPGQKKAKSAYAPAPRSANNAPGGFVHRKSVDVGQNPSPWFKRNITSGGPKARSNKLTLQRTNEMIEACVVAYQSGENTDVRFIELRNRIQQMAFYHFLTHFLIKSCKTLGEEGLPRIFDSKDSNIFPFDIRADAQALAYRWSRHDRSSGQYDLDTSLFRGIDVGSGTLQNGQKRTSYKFSSSYPFRRPCNVIGHNDIVNGQWWPLRICVMRDGAHGEMEGGIYGETNNGAYSVVVAAGGYADEDYGEVIKYCGTQSDTTELTKRTKFMVQALQKHQDIRVLRAVNPQSKYAPKKGIRYDGLYKVTGEETLDVATAMKRFTLSRNPNQDPIRYKGFEVRPTEKELEELEWIERRMKMMTS